MGPANGNAAYLARMISVVIEKRQMERNRKPSQRLGCQASATGVIPRGEQAMPTTACSDIG